MKVSELIKYIRVELGDEKNTRWKDDSQLLYFIRRACERASHIIERNGIPFGLAQEEIQVSPNVFEYDLPDDFMSPLKARVGNVNIKHLTIENYTEIESAPPLTYYTIFGDQIWFNGTPTESGIVKLIYYVQLDLNEITITSETPWDGKLDMLLIEYITLRAKNVNENSIAVDMEFLKDFEAAILNTYKTIDPIVIPSRGWM